MRRPYPLPLPPIDAEAEEARRQFRELNEKRIAQLRAENAVMIADNARRRDAEVARKKRVEVNRKAKHLLDMLRLKNEVRAKVKRTRNLAVHRKAKELLAKKRPS